MFPGINFCSQNPYQQQGEMLELIDVSVIIPCFNEEGTVAKVVSAVSGELRSVDVSFEVLVVDNGSADHSVPEARRAGAIVRRSDAPTVAGVRNDGAFRARGRILVFIDADVLVLPGWGRAFHASWIAASNSHVGGAHCKVPLDVPRLLRVWFIGIERDTRNTHVGTGHMIVHSEAFRRVGGFDALLATGEDYDFCLRARQRGVPVVPDNGLNAEHLGYPMGFATFFRREMWHGYGDCQSWRRFLRSKVALSGALFVGCAIAAVVTLLVVDPIVSILICLFMICFLAAVVRWKYGYQNGITYLQRMVVCSVYLFARGVAPLRRLATRGNRKRKD